MTSRYPCHLDPDGELERQARRADAEREQVETKDFTMKPSAEHRSRHGAPAEATDWEAWRRFIRKTMKPEMLRAAEMAASAAGELLGRFAREHDAELAAVKAELAELKAMVEAQKGGLKRVA